MKPGGIMSTLGGAAGDERARQVLAPSALRKWDVRGRAEDLGVNLLRRLGDLCRRIADGVYERYPTPEMIYLRHVYGDLDALRRCRPRDRDRAIELLVHRATSRGADSDRPARAVAVNPHST